jgi:PAS domain S-box-containing protein
MTSDIEDEGKKTDEQPGFKALKRAEQALRESEYKLHQIIETMPGLIWSTGPDGEPTHFNQRLLDYSGMPSEQFMHRGWEAFVHPADYPKAAGAFYHAIETGTSYQGVMRLRRADGQFRWHDARSEPLRDQQGRIVQWYGMAVDIDERKQAEDRLRRSEAYLAESQRLTYSGGWASVDRNGERRFVYWSDESYRIFEFDPLQGMPTSEMFWQRVHPDDRSRLYEEVQEALRQKRNYRVAFRILSADGTIKYLESSGGPADGELLERMGTFVDVTERKHAERALRESEAHLAGARRELQQMIDTIPIQVVCYSTDGRREFVNAAWKQYTGLSDEAALDTNWSVVVHPDDFATGETMWRNTLARAEVRLRRADGHYRWFAADRVALHDESGKVIKWYGTAHDIDERKKAEDQLRRSEAYLAEAQRLSHTGTTVYNETTILYFSDETYRIFGFDPRNGPPSREAAVQVFHPDDRERVQEDARRGVREKRDYKLELRLLLSDGTIKYIEGVAHPKFSPSGELIEIVSTIIDVTDRKRAEQALQESEAHARSAIDGIAGMVGILAPTGEVETVNRQTFEYFGLSLKELKNWETGDHIHHEELPVAIELVKRGLASGLPFSFELRLRRFDGEYRWFDARVVPVRDDSGRIVRWYNLLVDIEDRTRALAQLEQMQSDFAHINRVSMMGELAASLSHEITQPIASARNNARAAQNFLDMQPPDLSEVREALSCVVGDTDRAGDIVDRIRDHINKTPPRKDHFDLNEAINEVVVLGRSTISKNAVSLQTQLSDGLFPIHGDRVQLQQVVLNLVLNAAEAMGSVEAEPRELLISTEQHHTGVLVAVRDSGPGIDPAHLEHVFDAFYTTKSHGVGMGLSICRSIIDAHGGRLWAEANEPRGAVFQFTLPAVQVGP